MFCWSDQIISLFQYLLDLTKKFYHVKKHFLNIKKRICSMNNIFLTLLKNISWLTLSEFNYFKILPSFRKIFDWIEEILLVKKMFGSSKKIILLTWKNFLVSKLSLHQENILWKNFLELWETKWFCLINNIFLTLLKNIGWLTLRKFDYFK